MTLKDITFIFLSAYFVMDLMFNKTERITAFQAQAICASAKHCRKSSGLISVPHSTHSHQNWCSGSILFPVGWKGNLFSTSIPFPTRLHIMHIRQIPFRTDAAFYFVSGMFFRFGFCFLLFLSLSLSQKHELSKIWLMHFRKATTLQCIKNLTWVQ